MYRWLITQNIEVIDRTLFRFLSSLAREGYTFKRVKNDVGDIWYAISFQGKGIGKLGLGPEPRWVDELLDRALYKRIEDELEFRLITLPKEAERLHRPDDSAAAKVRKGPPLLEERADVEEKHKKAMVCYSDEDRDFNDRLYADLRTNGVQAWHFRKDAKWGETVWGEIDRSIKSYDKVMVICSENSLQSGPVLREIERALQREEQEGKNILFPIRIDDYIFDRWEHPRKADVVSKVVGDFRGWEQDADKYEAAFKKLLEALEAEG